MTGISSETANDDSTRRMQDKGKLVVSVCHGPAGLLSAISADGTWVFQG
jgi:putative intracellular protease/amidase